MSKKAKDKPAKEPEKQTVKVKTGGYPVPHLRDIKAEAQLADRKQIGFYLKVTRYKEAKAWEKDGFKTWEDGLRAILKFSRRSRSGLLAKVQQIKTLLDTGLVSYAQLDAMRDANATTLCVLYKKKGINAVWVRRAMKWSVDRFKEMVAKATKSERGKIGKLTLTLGKDLIALANNQFGRIQTLLNLPTRENAFEWMISQVQHADDKDILKSLDEGKKAK
jgi:hypothetical protein